MLKDDPY
jgi:hypothetical protein